ncbi:MAG: hypothetical protein U1E70_01135 [Acetobacteraceae bacterium]|nr:hypothetical protein [Pseudomonadota bacterium]
MPALISLNVRRLAPVALALLALQAGVARADLSSLPIPAWPGLPADDVNRMTAAAARLYEGHSIGTVERWRSPDTKNAGEVKLIQSFESHGMPCRRIDYTIRFNQQRNSPDHYVLTWCKVGDEGWKIVEIPPPRDTGEPKK